MKRKIYKSLSSAKKGLFALALTLFSGAVYAQTTYTFNYTGSTQTISLPAGNYSIECWGADGGNATNGSAPMSGGKGGYSSGVYTNSAITTFNIYVGGHGGNASGASNLGGGGGGMSDVAAASNPTAVIIVAGGGGGATSGSASEASTGGGGGGLVGGMAIDGAGVSTGAAATGGSQSAGGFATAGSYGAGFPGGYGYGGGSANGTSNPASPSGTMHAGGGAGGNGGNGGWNGGGGGCTFTGGNDHAAGGGAGYYGGGGGRGDGGAGGGGSGYIGGVTSGTTIMFGQAGFVTNPDVLGNGKVLIRELCGITLVASTANSLAPVICSGQSVTLTTNAISSYTWSTGSNAAAITVSPNVTTTYSLTAMSPSNCISSAAITITVSAGAPVLTVTASSPSVCLGNTVSISAAGALSYTFSGGISNGVSFAPVATTAYTIQGQNGCGTTSSVTTITITPLPVAALASSSVVCSGNTSTLTGAGATNYTWQPTGATGVTVAVSPQGNTIYTVTGVTGNCSGVNTVVVNANPNPTLTTSSTHTSLCQGQSATLTANGALGYTWQPGGQTGSVIVISPTSPTGYMVTGNNSFGCTGNAQQSMPVFASPTINLSTNTPTICSGGSATITATGANSYTWITGAFTNTISVAPATTTVYSVVGTNTNTQCTDTKTITLNVFVPNVLISPTTAICIGETATLSASGAQNYQWSTGGSGPIISVNPQSTTMYTVTGTTPIGSQNCAGSNTTQVAVNPLPTVTAVATRSNICKDEFTTLSVSGANTYTWSTAQNGTVISVNPAAITMYSVVGTDANGCKNSGSVLIRVYGCVGISENHDASNFQVYPNPSSGEIHIVSDKSMNLLLINELGQVLYKFELGAANGYAFSVEGLAKGLYFISSGEPTSRIHRKILVE